MRVFRNIGASEYRRWTGELVPSGQTFQPTSPKELATIDGSGTIGIRLHELSAEEIEILQAAEAARDAQVLASEAPATDPDEQSEQDDVSDEEKDPPKEWTLKISPEDYLKRYPDGPQAVLAQEIVTASTNQQ